ncbi:alpha/beta hydrolase [bacterium SCSIO 12696]|nr:alpha/beta hydrolase [bacterium SCSIO 12696]
MTVLIRSILVMLGVLCFGAYAKDSATENTEQAGVDWTPGLTHMYFSDWAGPRIPVWVYVPPTVDTETAPVLFMMHGAKRGAARYLSEWDQVADRDGFIVVAPEFNRETFPKSRQYQRGNVFDAEGAEIPESEWTFSAIEAIFDHLKQQLGSKQQRYTLYGHSAGSQFAHRYLLFVEQTRAKRFLPANAGWYTFADLDIDYPYGLKGSGVSESQLKAALQKDVVVLLGNKDNNPNHNSLKRSGGADAQGPHRYARGLAFYENARKNAKEYGVPFGWTLRVIDGVAHKNGGIAAASGDLVR